MGKLFTVSGYIMYHATWSVNADSAEEAVNTVITEDDDCSADSIDLSEGVIARDTLAAICLEDEKNE